MTAGQLVVFLVVAAAAGVALIRVAVHPLLVELRALRVDLVSQLALDRARRSAEEVAGP